MLAGHVDRRIGSVEHETRDPLRIPGGEHQGQLSAFRPAVDRRSTRSGRIHHRQQVADPLFDRLVGDAIREALAALVEHDHAREGGEPFQQILVGGQLPVELHVRHGARHEYDVPRAVPEDAVRDVNVTAPRVLRFGFHEARSGLGDVTPLLGSSRAP